MKVCVCCYYPDLSSVVVVLVVVVVVAGGVGRKRSVVRSTQPGAPSLRVPKSVERAMLLVLADKRPTFPHQPLPFGPASSIVVVHIGNGSTKEASAAAKGTVFPVVFLWSGRQNQRTRRSHRVALHTAQCFTSENCCSPSRGQAARPKGTSHIGNWKVLKGSRAEVALFGPRPTCRSR